MTELFAQILALVQGILITPIVWLFPIKWIIVRPGETALRYTRGHPSPDLKEGWHLATSTQVLVKEHTNARIAPTDPVTVLTKDGVPLQADAVVTYGIVDLASYLASAEDPEIYIAAVAEASLRTAISSRPFLDVMTESDKIEKEVRAELAKMASGCGVKIKHARFQNVKHCDPYTRMTCSLRSTSAILQETVTIMATQLKVPNHLVLAALSQNIQSVIDLSGLKRGEENS